MATVNDIDAKSAVRKFLEQSSIINKEDSTANSFDEIPAILSSVALSFLLYPQSVLSFILQAKNILQQIATTDHEIITYLLNALFDIENPDEPVTDTSDLVTAQTALIEVDKIGRVSNDIQAYTRYTKAINSFLDQQLASSLKRRNKNEFERTGSEAKQDIFKVLSVFNPTHTLMISHLTKLLNSIGDFRSVALTKIVSTQTIAKVRSSLTQIINGIQQQQLSNTASAIELLAGVAALNSISNNRDIYDPTVDTGTFPRGRAISISSERISAMAIGISTSVDLTGQSTPWIFNTTINGIPYSVTLPFTGASGRRYVKTSSGSLTYNIPVGANVLYVQFDGITPPPTEAAMVRAVALPTGGSISISAILTALNNGSTGLINGTAVQLGSTGRILIYGSSSVTKITIKNGERGTFDVTTGVYSPAPGTVHDVLGFSNEQTSGNPNIFSSGELMDLLAPYIPTANFSLTDIGTSVISTVSTNLTSSISFSGNIASSFGFIGSHIPIPSFLQLMEDGQAVDPTTIGIFIDSVVIASDIQSINNLAAPVTEIIGTELHFSPDILLPRCDTAHTQIVAPIVFAIQTLLDNLRVFKNSFDHDILNVQRVFSPILSKPTLAQINDAQRGLQAILLNIANLLASLTTAVVRIDRMQFDSISQQIIASLGERGLDKALELLQSCQFSNFFSLTSDGASKSTRFLTATENVGRNEFSQPTSEQDQNDSEPLGTTPSDKLLTGEELLEGEEQQ